MNSAATRTIKGADFPPRLGAAVGILGFVALELQTSDYLPVTPDVWLMSASGHPAACSYDGFFCDMLQKDNCYNLHKLPQLGTHQAAVINLNLRSQVFLAC